MIWNKVSKIINGTMTNQINEICLWTYMIMLQSKVSLLKKDSSVSIWSSIYQREQDKGHGNSKRNYYMVNCWLSLTFMINLKMKSTLVSSDQLIEKQWISHKLDMATLKSASKLLTMDNKKHNKVSKTFTLNSKIGKSLLSSPKLTMNHSTMLWDACNKQKDCNSLTS